MWFPWAGMSVWKALAGRLQGPGCTVEAGNPERRKCSMSSSCNESGNSNRQLGFANGRTE